MMREMMITILPNQELQAAVSTGADHCQHNISHSIGDDDDHASSAIVYQGPRTVFQLICIDC